MSLESKLALVLVLTAAAPIAGCKKGNEGTAKPAGSASAAASAAAAPAPAGLTADQLMTQLVPTVCTAMTECKNDKVKAMITMSGTMLAGFGSMDKPALKKQMDSVGASMDKDKRWLPNEQECEKIGAVDLQLLGLTPDKLKAKIGKTVKYDGKKAAACLKALSSLAMCKTEVKLKKEPTLGDMDKISSEIGKKADAETKPCNDMLVGTVELGGDCEYDYECKGEHTKCKKDHKTKKKVCKAGKKAAK